jgi:lipopolysaccharide/colanic/teichoic acid biosynthesis glycosyltransferase
MISRAAIFAFKRSCDIAWAVATIIMVCVVALLVVLFAIFAAAMVMREAAERTSK